VRRRRAALLAVAGAALVAGAAIGAQGQDGTQPNLAPTPPPAASATPTAAPARAPARPSAVTRLGLARQVGKLVVLRFQGTTAPAYVRSILRRGEASGAILFRDNIDTRGQLRALTGALRSAARSTPIICIDQEGGAVRNVGWAPPVAAQADQDPGPDARAAGRALRAVGINVALAPVADVPSVAGAALASRAYSRDPARVASAVAAAVRGWRASGVAPTAKHFPGLGGATVNTDRGSATIARGAPTAADLAPFRAAIAAGVPLVMSSHALYPALDRRRIASQSPAILGGLLRRRLGFHGVVMTDSMEAAAVRATGSLEQAAVRSVRAGADIVLTTGQGSWLRIYRALLAEAHRSPAFRARVRQSAARVLRLQSTLR
jgi:beta-N-acetylhexosaminidase